MRKEVKTVLKGLQEYADPKSSFKVQKGNHLKVSWDMTNDNGEQVNVLYVMGCTPSDGRWKFNHRQSLRKVFRENNITCEVL
jgi:hypothetical protein